MNEAIRFFIYSTRKNNWGYINPWLNENEGDLKGEKNRIFSKELGKDWFIVHYPILDYDVVKDK